MTLKFRFSLIGFGIIFFLITTPFLVLYARGFTFNWQTWKITKTGALVVKTDPAKATIFLNDKKQKSLTPNNVRFVLPGDYNIRIEKDNYQPWTKRLNVRAQLVTWANENRDFIALFLKDAKIDESWDFDQSSVSENNDEIIFTGGNGIELIKVKNAEISTLDNTYNIKSLINPFTNAQIKWQNAAAVIQALQNRSSFGINDKDMAKITAIQTNGSHFVAKIGTDLYSLDSNSPALLDKNILAFALDDDSIWYLQANVLKHYVFSTNQSEIVRQTVPAYSSSQMIKSNNQIFLILDDALYALNDNFEKIYDNVSQAAWSDTSGSLIFNNKNEILIYDPNAKKTELILRSTTEIKSPIINLETGYVFFQNEGKIKTVEMDDRDHRNIYTIADDPGNYALSENGKILYTFSKSKINKYLIR